MGSESDGVDWGANEAVPKPEKPPEPEVGRSSLLDELDLFPTPPEAPVTPDEQRPPAVIATEHPLERAPQEFNQSAPFKMGIIGARATGKTFLFQAMAYRASNPRLAGVLTPFLARDPPEIYHRTSEDRTASPMDMNEILSEYRQWRRLATTTKGQLHWYTLRLRTPCGFLGLGRSNMDIELLDAPGEALVGTLEEHRRMWHDAYVGARVIVFFVPLWVFFPKRDLSDQDHALLEATIKDFHRVVHHYISVRKEAGDTGRVQTVLALTMADDERSRLRSIRDRWIEPYVASDEYLRSFTWGGAVSRYLESARLTSDAMKGLFSELPDQVVSRLPDQLRSIGGVQPWFVPISAIDGRQLDDYEEQRKSKAPRIVYPPRPAHVELPLLLALCERDNALM